MGLRYLRESGVESSNVLVYLVAVISAEHDAELMIARVVVKERDWSLLLGHWDILADDRGAFARVGSYLFALR